MAFEAPETEGAAEAPLSVNDALSLLDASDDDLASDEGDKAEPAAEADEDDEASDQEADGDDAPDEDDPASEDDPDEDDGDEPAEPAIDAPEFWSAEEKALFAKAPPEVQLLVAAKTAEAEKRVYSAKEEAAAARKEASTIGEVRQLVDQQLERAQSIFQGKWDGVDWAQWARDNPTEAFQAKLEHDAEMEELTTLQATQAATAAEEHRQFLRAEHAKLVETRHPLADPEKGKDNKRALIEYLTAKGAKPEDLRWAGAFELEIAHKAMLYDKAQERLATKPPKEPTEKKPASLKPAGPPPSRRETRAKQIKSVAGRAYKTGRLNDAVALLDALED